ncbi:MAG: dTDP-4-dehydrorhamnose reductase [Paracoccaceae bacterium]
MTILVFGKTGQVAQELAAFDGVVCLNRTQADLSDPETCVTAIRSYRPVAVINAAAFTAVDQAEDNETLATQINGHTPGLLAQTCANMDIPFVSLSTDYVFNGMGETPWRSDDMAEPLNAYGRSKLVGERAISQAGGKWAVVRTSWVVSAHGNNFVKTMLRLGRDRDALSIVGDQIGAPTPAKAIAAACLEIADQLIKDSSKSGFYHLSGQPDTSWFAFAQTIFEIAGITCAVTPISTQDYPTPARRPLNSRLDCASLETVFDIKRPDWQHGLRDILSDLGELDDQ